MLMLVKELGNIEQSAIVYIPVPQEKIDELSAALSNCFVYYHLEKIGTFSSVHNQYAAHGETV